MNLYYFTGTGNTLFVAKKLKESFPEAKLVNIANLDENTLIDASNTDKIGILYPVYIFGTPLILNRFIKRLKVKENSYIFSVCTYGGLLSKSLYVLKEKLEEENLWLNAGFAVNLPGNAVAFYDTKSDKKIEKMERKALKKIDEIVQSLKDRENNTPDKNLGFVGTVFSDKIYPAAEKNWLNSDKVFFTDDKCNLCKTCVKVCPVDNISVVNNTIHWNHKCEQCYACINWCPQEAIQANKKTTKRGRYHNKHIAIDEIYPSK